ncbi:4-coumarate--CoA ligase 1 [Diachasma alloeum]|uniref:4-coumarate--CoA ligase 1 n=1 Tax=Diachasma alloeum TaxID=454923 RepID=UPI0007381936|nr:4-coumarate--CoA ligase 1 [Diachasma alloeum]
MEEERIIRGPPGPKLRNMSVGQLILEQLQTSPLRIVQIDAHTGKILTSHDLLEKSVRLAVALQEWGLNSDDVVAISSETQSNWFVAACAAMYLGNCVAPFNPAYVENEIRHVLMISRPRIIFVSRRTSGSVRRVALTLPWEIEIIQLDEENPIEDIVTVRGMISGGRQWPDPHRYQAVVVDEPSTREAVILCSSGTTGLPKGVMLSHKNILAASRCAHLLDFVPTGHGIPVVMFFLPLFHGYGLATMLTVIQANATAVMMKSFEPKLFCESVQKYRVTFIPLVPPIMGFLAKHPIVDNYDFSSVREIVCGAAPLSREVLEAVQKRMKNKEMTIRNGYGMTELSVITHISDHFTKKADTLGSAVTGIQLKVIDPETGKCLGPNKTGELCFKGDHVMMGYKGDPRATAETIDSTGWLHTGDLGYYDTDGELFVVGRLKELIKYKGFQIAPAEIENLLMSHDQVEDAAVVGRNDDVAGEIPLAFVVRRKGANVTAEELCRFVNGQLSAQKHLRGGVRFIEAIPKNPGGKILRRELLKLLPKL